MDKEKKREIDRLYRLKNKEKIKIKKKEYYEKIKNTEEYKEKKKKYNFIYNQTEKRKLYNKLLKRKNYKKNKEKQLEYWKKNPEKYLLFLEWKKNYNKNYKKKHKEKILLQRKDRLKKDKDFNMRNVLRSRIYTVLKRKNTTKLESTLTLLGVDNIDTVLNHLKSKFEPWMNWDNHGKWHIDHIKPCASFDLRCPVQQLACFHYTNLQPLKAIDNLKKGAKIIHG
jgi:hypothetical protein